MMRIPSTIIVLALALAALLPAQERRRPGPERAAPTERAQRENREAPRGERRERAAQAGAPRREQLMARVRDLRDRLEELLERDGKAPLRMRGGERRGGGLRGLREARAGRPMRPPASAPRAGHRTRARGGDRDG